METTSIDLDAPGGELLAVAAVFAVLAYPNSRSKRNTAVRGLLAFMGRAARDLGMPISSQIRLLIQQVPRRRQAEILGSGRKGLLPRIHRRLCAAEVAERVFKASAWNAPLSLNQIAATWPGNSTYFLHSIWSESKPVLHLAIATRRAIRQLENDGRPTYIQLLADPSWVRDALTYAERWLSVLSTANNDTNKAEFLKSLDADKFVRLLAARNCADSPTTP